MSSRCNLRCSPRYPIAESSREVRTAGLPGIGSRQRGDINGVRSDSSSPIQYMDYAQPGIYVDTPQVLSRKATSEKDSPSSAANERTDTNIQTAPRRCVSTRDLRSPLIVQLSLCIGTQEDQNKKDEDARSKALKELVSSWMDRLQLISVIVGPCSSYRRP